MSVPVFPFQPTKEQYTADEVARLVEDAYRKGYSGGHKIGYDKRERNEKS